MSATRRAAIRAANEIVRAAKSDRVRSVVPAVVVSVTPGAAGDGGSLVTVAFHGASVEVPYLATYAPTVGHVVACALVGNQLLILGRIVGTPPTT